MISADSSTGSRPCVEPLAEEDVARVGEGGAEAHRDPERVGRAGPAREEQHRDSGGGEAECGDPPAPTRARGAAPAPRRTGSRDRCRAAARPATRRCGSPRRRRARPARRRRSRRGRAPAPTTRRAGQAGRRTATTAQKTAAASTKRIPSSGSGSAPAAYAYLAKIAMAPKPHADATTSATPREWEDMRVILVVDPLPGVALMIFMTSRLTL